MSPGFFSGEHKRTAYIQIDTRKCKACWKCEVACTHHVIGRIDLPWHRHAIVTNPAACSGCLCCTEACPNGAVSKTGQAGQEAARQWRRRFNRFLVNSMLVAFGALITLSGLVLQVGFHMGGPHVPHGVGRDTVTASMTYVQVRGIDTARTEWGHTYPEWSAIHKTCIVIFLLLMASHIRAHWNWYMGVFRKHLAGKNKQVLILSTLFLAVAVTGLIPWFIDLAGNTGQGRMLFIEIHDKITFLLIALLVIHIFTRRGWFLSAYERLKKDDRVAK